MLVISDAERGGVAQEVEAPLKTEENSLRSLRVSE